MQLVEALDGMNRKFAAPYIFFYPIISRDGMPFPVNRAIRHIQGPAFEEDQAWRGNIVVAKYRDNPFTSMMDASMADFPIVKNFLLTHGSPGQVCSSCNAKPPVIHNQHSELGDSSCSLDVFLVLPSGFIEFLG